MCRGIERPTFLKRCHLYNLVVFLSMLGRDRNGRQNWVFRTNLRVSHAACARENDLPNNTLARQSRIVDQQRMYLRILLLTTRQRRGYNSNGLECVVRPQAIHAFDEKELEPMFAELLCS